MSDPTPLETIIERAYFHVGNGGLTLSIIEVRPGGGGNPLEYRFRHELSLFGQKAESSFPLGSAEMVSWMNMALQRVSMKVASAYQGLSFQPFDNPVDVTHMNGEQIEKLASSMRIVARFQRERVGYEFSSPEALHKYLHEHPQADKSLHTVKKPGHDAEPKGEHEHEEKPKKSWKERLQSISEKAKAFVKAAPGEIKKFIDDDAHRRTVLQKMHKAVESMPRKAFENAKHAVRHEAAEFKAAHDGIKAVLSGGQMTKEQKHAVKTVAFDVALTVATSAVTGGLGGGFAGLAAKSAASFSKALAKKIALNTVSHGLGRHLTLEELGHFGHGVFEHLVLAADAEKKNGDESDLVTAYIAKLVMEELKDLDADTLAEALEDASGED